MDVYLFHFLSPKWIFQTDNLYQKVSMCFCIPTKVIADIGEIWLSSEYVGVQNYRRIC